MSPITHIVIAMQKIEMAEKIKSLLVQRGYTIDGVFQSGTQALCRLYTLDEGLVISGFRCSDMNYNELKEQLPDTFSMIVLTPASALEDMEAGVMALTLPLKASELVRGIEICFEQQRRQKRKSTGARMRSEKDQAIIDMAKASIMTLKSMTEPEAYRYMQKHSMNSKMTMEDFARHYLLHME